MVSTVAGQRQSTASFMRRPERTRARVYWLVYPEHAGGDLGDAATVNLWGASSSI